MAKFYTLTDLIDGAPDFPHAVLSVFGDPVAHSLSPQLHNPALRECGIAGEYVRIEVKEAEFRQALRRIQEMGFYGTNVTIPHKFTALDSVDVVSDQARKLGAVNTIIFSDGKALGENSDGPGFVRAVREAFGVGVGDVRVLVIGAGGGAGRAVAVQCALENCQELVLMNRTLDKAQALKDEIKAYFPEHRIRVMEWNLDEITSVLPQVDLVINGTSLGMKPDDAPVLAGGVLSSQHLAYDMVYRPYETTFLKEAKAAGAKTINGLPMLLHQGAVSFEWWFNRPAPIDVMRAGLWGAL